MCSSYFFFFDGGEGEQVFCFSLCVRPVYESCSTEESSNMENIALNLGLINDLLLLCLIRKCLWLTITFTSFYLIITIKTLYGEIIHLIELRTVAFT